MEESEDMIFAYQGSGSIVSSNSIGIFIATADHVCTAVDKKEEEVIEFLSDRLLEDRKKHYLKPRRAIRAMTFQGQTAYADIIAQDAELDACVLFAEGLTGYPLRRYYGRVSPGTEYYNIAAPLNSFMPGLVPMFAGRYLGLKNSKVAVYTIPAVGGSSGSPILDQQGRLVGILHSILTGFTHISYATDISLMNKFLDDNMEIYHDNWHQNMLKLTRPKTN
tara:strand:+ start:4296 stop:4958 length:663 start_codon:yes stop_codon:yes gene_type:complete